MLKILLLIFKHRNYRTCVVVSKQQHLFRYLACVFLLGNQFPDTLGSKLEKDFFLTTFLTRIQLQFFCPFGSQSQWVYGR